MQLLRDLESALIDVVLKPLADAIEETITHHKMNGHISFKQFLKVGGSNLI